MNTNNNTYTVFYSIILVVVVAGILAFAASALKPKQLENAALEKMKTILLAANIGHDSGKENNGSSYIKETYKKYITDSYILDYQGHKLDGNAFDVDLKSQYDLIKQIISSKDETTASSIKNELRLPVYICTLDDGKMLNIFPCYGAGLWGPIWGYISVGSDYITIYGAIFDHKSETPGLGAEIASPWFYDQFRGKQLVKNGSFSSVEIVKGGGQASNPNGVDAISGGTITSKSLQKTIQMWLKDYQPYFDIQKQMIEALHNETDSTAVGEQVKQESNE